ncbi:serine/threonine-protein kinase [Streptomyces abikoensis]|uniref:non-specific serine/threonine protein kinase n=1 Tax=Streptomyces abikoensis TaxID=97398 RepID=A0ABW7TCM5_9ACTN
MAGRFLLLGRLGSGGMGTVWRARDLQLQREVALKEVRHPGTDSDGDAARVRERVLREARALARLQHPNVVTIHQVLDDEPVPWLVMELVAGTSLQELLESGPLPPDRAARIGCDVLAALRAAHEAGVEHRDVKPANVIVRPDGTSVLTDFGIAAMEGLPGLTVEGGVVGTPEFVAPERAAGERGGPAADLWSLGMLLYVAVEGVSPLRRDSPLATLAAVREVPLPAPRRAGPLEPVLRSVLARVPAERPAAPALAGMLAAVARGDGFDGDTAVPHVPRALHVPTMVDARAAGPASEPTWDGALGTTAVPGGAGPAPGRARRGVIVLACLVTGAVAAALCVRAVNDSSATASGTSAASAPTVSAPLASKPAPARSPAPDAVGLPTGPGSDSDLSSASPSPSAEEGEALAGGWLAQLASVSVSDGTGARDRELAAVRRQVPGAQVLRSDSYASLRPGYWVVYAPGSFPDGRSAVAFCTSIGRTTDSECVGRYLSHRASDIDLVCLHAPGGGTAGRCERDGVG